MTRDGVPVYALIPARGGSKGVPNKNISLVGGKPLITYTIDAAKHSVYIDQIYVSSDSDLILEVAEKSQVHPLNRPSIYAQDDSSSVEVVQHFIKIIPSNQISLNPYIIYLQPTSPLRKTAHIDAAIELMQESKAHSVISVVEAEKPPQKSFQLDPNGRLISLFEEKISNARRQDLPKCFYPNGAIYCFRVKDFINRNGFPSNGSVPFVMSNTCSVDVDEFADLVLVEKTIGGNNA